MTEKRRPSLETCLAGLHRSAKAALFLRELLSIWSHSNRQVDGKFWIWRSREDWADLLEMNVRTFDGHLSALRKGGWVETTQAQLLNRKGKPYGLKILHCRPTDDLLKRVHDQTGRSIERPKVKWPVASGAAGQPAPNPGSSPAPNSAAMLTETPQECYAVSSTVLKDTSYLSIKGTAEGTGIGIPLPGSALSSGNDQGSPGGTGTEKKTPPSPPVPICGTPSSIWKKAVAESNPGTFAGLSGPDAGKLKNFAMACAEGGLPDHAGNVIEHVARNWLEFTSEAEKKASAWKTPLQPDPGFLLKYVQVAVNFWLDTHKLHLVGGSLQTVQPQTPEPKSASGMNVPKKLKAVTAPVDDDDKPVTQEEFMDIIGTGFFKPKK